MKLILFFVCIVSSFYFSTQEVCQDNTFTGKLTPDQYKGILDYHNQKRNDIATGGKEVGLSSGALPTAADMTQLYWDDNLATLAQSWATQLVKNCVGLGHNPNRQATGFSYIGENVAWRAGSSVPTTVDVSSYCVDSAKSWYSEIKDYDITSVGSFTSKSPSGGVIGHFTQMAWASTRKIGCGFAQYKSDKYAFNVYVVCNYGEGGNITSKPMYTSGGACSKCPSGLKCNTSGFTGLCADPSAPTPGPTSGLAPSPNPVSTNSSVLVLWTIFAITTFLLFF